MSHRWKIEEWSECSTSCGVGVKYRQVMCVGGVNESQVSQVCVK